MMKLLKNFGLGLAWIILFPIFLVVFALAGVAGLINFLIQTGKIIICFFTGKKLFPMLPEDKMAKKIIEQKNQNKLVTTPAPAETPIAQPQPTVINNYYNCPPPAEEPIVLDAQPEPLQLEQTETLKLEKPDDPALEDDL